VKRISCDIMVWIVGKGKGIFIDYLLFTIDYWAEIATPWFIRCPISACIRKLSMLAIF